MFMHMILTVNLTDIGLLRFLRIKTIFLANTIRFFMPYVSVKH